METLDKNVFEEAYKKSFNPMYHHAGLDRHRPLEPHPRYRVYMIREGEKFIFYVGDSMTRIFTVDTLPDDLKQQLAMIIGIGAVGIPQSSMPAHDIGWAVSKEYVDLFIFILSDARLLALRGEEVS